MESITIPDALCNAASLGTEMPKQSSVNCQREAGHDGKCSHGTAHFLPGKRISSFNMTKNWWETEDRMQDAA